MRRSSRLFYLHVVSQFVKHNDRNKHPCSINVTKLLDPPQVKLPTKLTAHYLWANDNRLHYHLFPLRCGFSYFMSLIIQIGIIPVTNTMFNIVKSRHIFSAFRGKCQNYNMGISFLYCFSPFN